MAELIHRRSLLALSSLALVASCSQPAYETDFTATDEALPSLMLVIDRFVREYEYRKVGDLGADNFGANYEGWRTRFWLWRYEGDTYGARFDHKSDLWLLFWPSADLGAFIGEFVTRIAQVDGVSVRNL